MALGDEARRTGLGRRRALEAIVSPINRGSMYLVLSLVNVSTSGADRSDYEKWFFDRDRGANVAGLPRASELEFLVRDDDGTPVPLTEQGMTWLINHDFGQKSPLTAGDAIGTLLPLEKAFAMKPGHGYTVLVALRKGRTCAGLGFIARPRSPGKTKGPGY